MLWFKLYKPISPNKPAADFNWFCHEKANNGPNFEKRCFILAVLWLRRTCCFYHSCHCLRFCWCWGPAGLTSLCKKTEKQWSVFYSIFYFLLYFVFLYLFLFLFNFPFSLESFTFYCLSFMRKKPKIHIFCFEAKRFPFRPFGFGTKNVLRTLVCSNLLWSSVCSNMFAYAYGKFSTYYYNL